MRGLFRQNGGMESRTGGDRESPAKERTVNTSGFLEKVLLFSLSANLIRYCLAAAQARVLYEAVMECNKVLGAGADLLAAQFDGIFGIRQERLKSEDCT